MSEICFVTGIEVGWGFNRSF